MCTTSSLEGCIWETRADLGKPASRSTYRSVHMEHMRQPLEGGDGLWRNQRKSAPINPNMNRDKAKVSTYTQPATDILPTCIRHTIDAHLTNRPDTERLSVYVRRGPDLPYYKASIIVVHTRKHTIVVAS